MQKYQIWLLFGPWQVIIAHAASKPQKQLSVKANWGLVSAVATYIQPVLSVSRRFTVF